MIRQRLWQTQLVYSRQWSRLYSTNPDVFQVGDVITLRDRRGNRKLLGPLQTDAKIDTHKGVVKHDDIIGKPVRCLIQTHKGTFFTVHKPSLEELTTLSRRRVTPIYSKDAFAILQMLDIRPDDLVFEAGTGNGSLVLHLLSCGARVISCDVNPENTASAKQIVTQFERGRFLDRVQFESEGVENYINNLSATSSTPRMFSGIVLDMPNPHLHMARLLPFLENDKFMIVYLPNLTQVMACVEAIENIQGFYFDKCVDVSWRDWDIRKTRVRSTDEDAWVTRPKNFDGATSFTAFLCCFRKGETFVPESTPDTLDTSE